MDSRDVVFVDRPVELSMSRGVIRAEVFSGEEVLHLAFDVPTFLESFARAGLLAHQWQMGRGGDVVAITSFKGRST